MGKPTTSATSLACFFSCPFMWYFRYVLHKPLETTYPMFCGTVVHGFIAILEKHSKKRRFYYKTLGSAKGAWKRYYWNEIKDDKRFHFKSRKKYDDVRYYNFGWECIEKYWTTNIEKPAPISVESDMPIIIEGIEVDAKPDQLRVINPSAVLKWRPELILPDGKLDPRYDNVAIFDIKTRYDEWNPPLEKGKLIRIKDIVPFTERFQAIIYTRAYKIYNKEKFPIGFVYYILPENTFALVAVEDDAHQADLVTAIIHWRDNLNARSFPKRSGDQCQSCCYYKICSNQKNTDVLIDKNLPISGFDNVVTYEDLEKKPGRVFQRAFSWGRPSIPKIKRHGR